MPIFQNSYYSFEKKPFFDAERYRIALIEELDRYSSNEEKASILRIEAIELTEHIAKGITDLIKQDRHIRNLVLNQGAIPLATWAVSLEAMATFSFEKLKFKILDMKQDLENGRVEGFPATLHIKGKPSFTTFEGFYNIIFDLAEDLGLIG